MSPTQPIQTQDTPTPVSSDSTAQSEPQTKEGQRLAQQSRDAIDNNRDGFRHKPMDLPPASPETFEESDTGGTEPTHVPTRRSDHQP